MSWSEINHNRGMPYGGVPADVILERLEETDMRGAPSAAPTPGDGFTGLAYKDYMIGEIIDRTPDQGFLESDRARRNPQMSREVLNTRYNGTRGSTGAELPRHPELFLGFTGDDPRGTTNDPRFEEMRAQMAHRTRLLEPTMGNSVGHDGGFGAAPHQEAERPWTGPALQKMRTSVHEDMRRRMKIFTAEKEGRSAGNSVVGRGRAQSGLRAARSATLGSGGEQWASGAGTTGGLERSDSRTLADGTREGYVASRQGRKLAEGGRHAATESTIDMPVAKYGRTLRGRTRGSGAEAIRAMRRPDRQQQDWGRTRGGRSVAGSKALSRAMTEGARSRRAATVRDPAAATAPYGAPADGVTSSEISRRAHAKGFSSDASASDVAQAYYHASPDQTPGTQLVGRAAVPGQALAKGARDDRTGATQQLPWRAEQNHIRATLATNMAQAARQAGQHASTADLVTAAFQAVADGARHDPFIAQKGVELSSGRGVVPGEAAAHGGHDRVKQQAQAAVHAAAASRNLEVTSYSGRTPVEGGHMSRTNMDMLAAAAGGQRVHSAAAARHMQNAILSQKRPEYRGQTQTSGHSETHEQRLMREGQVGADTDAGARTPGLRMGLKAARYDRVAAADGGDFASESAPTLGESTLDFLNGV